MSQLLLLFGLLQKKGRNVIVQDDGERRQSSIQNFVIHQKGRDC